MAEMDGVYEEHAALVYRYLFSLTRNHDLSEELTQETFYQALRTIDRFKGACKFSTWLCQIAKHCWYKHLRKHAHKEEAIPHDMAAHDTSPERMVIDAEDRISIYKHIHALSEVQREVVLLRIMGDLSFRDIAEIMGKTEVWARVSFHRARIALIERSAGDEGQL